MGAARAGAVGWFRANKLKLNADKTSTMWFTSGRRLPDNTSTAVAFLGVTLDPGLTWEPHVGSLSKKLCSIIYLLRNLSGEVTPDVLLTAYHALFQSLISYAILIWDHSSHGKRIFALQRRAVRVVAGLRYRDDVESAFIDKKILTFPSLYIYHCLAYAKKNFINYDTHAETHTTTPGIRINKVLII